MRKASFLASGIVSFPGFHVREVLAPNLPLCVCHTMPFVPKGCHQRKEPPPGLCSLKRSYSQGAKEGSFHPPTADLPLLYPHSPVCRPLDGKVGYCWGGSAPEQPPQVKGNEASAGGHGAPGCCPLKGSPKEAWRTKGGRAISALEKREQDPQALPPAFRTLGLFHRPCHFEENIPFGKGHVVGLTKGNCKHLIIEEPFQSGCVRYPMT